MTLAEEIKRIKRIQKYLIVITTVMTLSDIITKAGNLILSIM